MAAAADTSHDQQPDEPVKGHVLVVEDEPAQSSILKAMLERSGYRVSLADTAKETEHIVFTYKPDLVLLDIMLPDGNGMNVLASIRRFYSAAELPVVIISANDHEEFVEWAEQLDVAEFLTKPTRTAVMLETIDLALEDQQRRQVAERRRERERKETDSIEAQQPPDA